MHISLMSLILLKMILKYKIYSRLLEMLKRGYYRVSHLKIGILLRKKLQFNVEIIIFNNLINYLAIQEFDE